MMLAGVICEPCASEHLQTEADVHRQRKENQGQAEPRQQAAETVDAIDDGLVSRRPQPQRVDDQVLNHHDAEDDACYRMNLARAEPLSASAGTRFIDLCSRGRRADLNYMQCFHHDVVSGCQYESALTTSTRRRDCRAPVTPPSSSTVPGDPWMYGPLCGPSESVYELPPVHVRRRPDHGDDLGERSYQMPCLFATILP